MAIYWDNVYNLYNPFYLYHYLLLVHLKSLGPSWSSVHGKHPPALSGCTGAISSSSASPLGRPGMVTTGPRWQQEWQGKAVVEQDQEEVTPQQ